MSVAAQDVDSFEKSYIDIMSTAPKIQKYVSENSSPEDLTRRKNLSRACIGLGGVFGAAIPLFITRDSGITKKVTSTVLGIVAGLSAGFAASLSISTPPGTFKFAKAARNLSKIDIQPVAEENVLKATRM